MIISVDIETEGLDCTKFICGTIHVNEKNENFTNKKEMWNRILELGKKENKRNKILNVYAHNHSYDFHGYADLTDTNIKYYCLRPFIASYQINGKERIKFLDTLAIFRMPLKELGEIVELKKLEPPKGMQQGTSNYFELKQYMERDAQICTKAIKKLKKQLKNDNVAIKRIYTINQIAINYMLNELKKENTNIFYNKRMNQIYRTHRTKEIHKAYRGGRVEAYKVGIQKNVKYIDCNSLYPYAATQIKFPDLTTEKIQHEPSMQKTSQLINKIGIIKCCIKNKTNKLGILPIRKDTESYYPKENTTLIGTWTLEEIRTAITNGYELQKVEWIIHYEETKNPYRNIIPKLYKKRLDTTNKWNKYLYKMIMNASFGKLAQLKTEQEIRIDSVEKAKEYIENNYKIIKAIGMKYLYKKEPKRQTHKNYYCPIIPTLINAKARIIMYNTLKKFKKEDLIYTDTDSVIHTGKTPNSIKQGNELGEFKTEHENAQMTIYGKKTYMINEEIKISGSRKRDIKKEEFEKGTVTTQKMLTIKTAPTIQQAGTFTKEPRDLIVQMWNHIEQQNNYKEETIHIDNDIQNINNYIEVLQ